MYAAIFVGHSQDVFDIHIFNRALQRNRRETRKQPGRTEHLGFVVRSMIH